MILDYEFQFSGTTGTTGANGVSGVPQALSGTVAQNSTNVFDAGVAKMLVGGAAGKGPRLVVTCSAVTGTTPTLQAQFVGADDAALSVNTRVIAQVGPTRALLATDMPLILEAVLGEQLDAKRYYGVIYLQTGTAPTANVTANLAFDGIQNVRNGP